MNPRDEDSGDAFIHSYPVAPTRIAPVSLPDRQQSHKMLQVKNIAASLRFYSVHLNFKLIRAWQREDISYVSLKIADEVLILYALREASDITEHKRISFTLSNLNDYLEVIHLYQKRILINQRNDQVIRLQTIDPDDHILDFRLETGATNNAKEADMRWLVETN